MTNLPKPGEKDWPKCRYCGVEMANLREGFVSCENTGCVVCVTVTLRNTAEAIAALNAPLPTGSREG